MSIIHASFLMMIHFKCIIHLWSVWSSILPIVREIIIKIFNYLNMISWARVELIHRIHWVLISTRERVISRVDVHWIRHLWEWVILGLRNCFNVWFLDVMLDLAELVIWMSETLVAIHLILDQHLDIWTLLRVFLWVWDYLLPLLTFGDIFFELRIIHPLWTTPNRILLGERLDFRWTFEVTSKWFLLPMMRFSLSCRFIYHETWVLLLHLYLWLPLVAGQINAHIYCLLMGQRWCESLGIFWNRWGCSIVVVSCGMGGSIEPTCLLEDLVCLFLLLLLARIINCLLKFLCALGRSWLLTLEMCLIPTNQISFLRCTLGNLLLPRVGMLSSWLWFSLHRWLTGFGIMRIEHEGMLIWVLGIGSMDLLLLVLEEFEVINLITLDSLVVICTLTPFVPFGDCFIGCVDPLRFDLFLLHIFLWLPWYLILVCILQILSQFFGVGSCHLLWFFEIRFLEMGFLLHGKTLVSWFGCLIMRDHLEHIPLHLPLVWLCKTLVGSAHTLTPRADHGLIRWTTT